MMRWAFSVLMMALLTTMGAVAAVTDTSYTDASGARVVREWVMVDAPRPAVWHAFVDDGEFAKWAGLPIAHIVPGNGGSIEFGFMPNSKIGDAMNVRHKIDVFLPDELLVFHSEYVPAGGPFDPPAFGAVRTLMSFEDAGAGRTKVTETVVGFGAGAKFDALYAHLHDGNIEYLQGLAGYFAKR